MHGTPADRSPSSFAPGQRVGHYEILAEIGKGGMGAVYRARDLHLGREVALKRPHPQLAANADSLRRFMREARAASSLSHPNIVPIFEVFECDATPWLVMPLVEGPSLRRLIHERGPLAVDEALRHAEELAEALGAAHAKRILHRDVNPNNVIIGPDGRALLADFGLAGFFVPAEEESEAETQSAPITGEGQLVGTPGYTSPEQALGHGLDGRSDIFSLGAVLYEMCAGKSAFRASNDAETLDHLLHREPIPLSNLNHEIPADLERIVRKALAKRPEERYPDTRDLLVDLRSVRRKLEHDVYTQEHPEPPGPHVARWGRRAALAAGALLLIFALVAVARRETNRPETPTVPTLAVSTFRNLEGDPGSDYFAPGFTDSVVSRLGGLEGVYVIRAGGDIAPDLLLEGDLRRSGDSLRVEYRLLDRRNRRTLERRRVEGTTAEVFRLQDDVAADVARTLRAGLNLKGRYVSPPAPTRSVRAYDLYLRGQYHLSRFENPDNIDLAIGLFQESSSEDRRFAAAQAGLGMAFYRKYELTRRRDWVEKARQSCERAADLDPALGIAYLCLGTVHIGLGQYGDASRDFLVAIRLDATNDQAYAGLGVAHEALGEPEQAEKALKQAIALHPTCWAGYRMLCAFYFRSARYPEAAKQCEQAVALAPGDATAHASLGGVYIAMGRYEEAITALEHAVAIRPTYEAVANLGSAYFNLRRFDEAVKAYERAITFDNADLVPYGNLARAYYFAPGRRDQARPLFERAISMGDERLAINPKDADAHILLAYDHAMVGDRDAALGHLEDALALRPTDPEFQFFAGLIHLRLGQRDRALGWLERAVAGGYSTAEIRASVELDALRDDSRFSTLLAKR